MAFSACRLSPIRKSHRRDQAALFLHRGAETRFLRRFLAPGVNHLVADPRIIGDPKLKILDQRKAASATRVFHQLWRNTVFAEWMSLLDHPATQAFHVNLVHKGAEVSNQQEFTALLHPQFKT